MRLALALLISAVVGVLIEKPSEATDISLPTYQYPSVASYGNQRFRPATRDRSRFGERLRPAPQGEGIYERVRSLGTYNHQTLVTGFFGAHFIDPFLHRGSKTLVFEIFPNGRRNERLHLFLGTTEAQVHAHLVFSDMLLGWTRMLGLKVDQRGDIDACRGYLRNSNFEPASNFPIRMLVLPWIDDQRAVLLWCTPTNVLIHRG